MSKIFMPPTYSCYSEYIASYGRTGKSSGRAVRVRDRVFAPLAKMLTLLKSIRWSGFSIKCLEMSTSFLKSSGL